MERSINIAFMVLLLIPVAGFLVVQNRFLHRLLKKQTKQKGSIKKPSTAQLSTAAPKEPVSLRERRKKRHEERKKALYR